LKYEAGTHWASLSLLPRCLSFVRFITLARVASSSGLLRIQLLPPRLLRPLGVLVAAGAPPRRSDPGTPSPPNLTAPARSGRAGGIRSGNTRITRTQSSDLISLPPPLDSAGAQRDAASYGEREAAAARPSCVSFRARSRHSAAAVCRRCPVRPASEAGSAAASAWCCSTPFRGRAARVNGWVQGSTSVPGSLCRRATAPAAFYFCAAASGPFHLHAAVSGSFRLCSTTWGPLYHRSTISWPLRLRSTVSGSLRRWPTASGTLCFRTSTFPPPAIVPWAATISHGRCFACPTEFCKAVTTTVPRFLLRSTSCEPSIPKASISTASADYAAPSNGT
jgi:hypothetical protein